jgi:hypothetical protein
MPFLHSTHPYRAHLSGGAIAHRDDPIGLKSLQVIPGLAFQISDIVTTLF